MVRKEELNKSTKVQDPTTEKGKRVVWKSAFSTPFKIKWPDIESEVSEKLLEEFLKLLDGGNSISPNDASATQGDCLSISEYKASLRSSKKRKKLQEHVSTGNKKSSEQISDNVPLPPNTSSIEPQRIIVEEEMTFPQRPPILSQLLSGINAITKELESEIRQASGINEARSDGVNSKIENEANQTSSELSLIFVCKDDLNPISLAEHLLPTVATLNQHRLLGSAPGISKYAVIIIPLLKGAEERLATALGIKRAAVVGLRGDHHTDIFQMAKNHIKPILPTNLINEVKNQQTLFELIKNENKKEGMIKLISTHVKFYKTTAPIDMRKHQLERLERKKLVREKHKKS